jgi:hypothetical protein
VDDDAGRSCPNRTDKQHCFKRNKEMRLGSSLKTRAFTLVEMLIAMGIAVAIIAVTLTTSVGLQKSFYSIDNYFGTHMQQIRIVDYLARDVRRGLSVVSSADKHTVTVNLPRYIIQAGDADATGSNIGTPRAPSLAVVNRDYNVNYLPTSTSSPALCTIQLMALQFCVRKTTSLPRLPQALTA